MTLKECDVCHQLFSKQGIVNHYKFAHNNGRTLSSFERGLVDKLIEWNKRLREALDGHFEISSSSNSDVAKIIFEMENIIRGLSWNPEAKK